MIEKSALSEIKKVLRNRPAVKLGYFFGSRAEGNEGPLSDYDFAFYADSRNQKKLFELKLDLQGEVSRIVKTDKVDVVMLNLTESPELKYDILQKGILFYEIDPFKVLVEPRILNEYFDFHEILKRYNLTRV